MTATKTRVGMLLMMLAIVAILLCASVGCTPQQRLNRLIKKHPELLQKDTLLFRDTVVTKTLHTDTIVHRSSLKDTITLVKDNLRVQVYEYRDSVFIIGSVAADTIYIEKKIPFEKVIYKGNKYWPPPWWAIYIVALFVIIFIIDRLLPRKNRS